VGCKVTVNDCSNGGCPDAGFGSGGESETDSGSGGSTSTGGTKSTGGKGGTGGSSTGGSKSTGGTSSGGTSSTMDSGPVSCDPQSDPPGSCARCIDSKCCSEWLDCTTDADCNSKVGSKEAEFTCIQTCLTSVDSGIMTLEECASNCQHDTLGISAATNALIACMRDTGDSGTTQNCTQECFLRDLP
jgi:hypothetical protein